MTNESERDLHDYPADTVVPPSSATPRAACELSAPEEAPLWPSPGPGPRRVLVVDDDPLVLRAMLRGARTAGFESLGAPSGEDALRLLAVNAVHVVVSDIHMPRMDGFELLHHIGRLDLGAPVVLMSAAPELYSAAKAAEGGALGVMFKPVTGLELGAVLRHALRAGELYRLERDALRLADELGVPICRELFRRAVERAREEIEVSRPPWLHAGERQTATAPGPPAAARGTVVAALRSATDGLEQTWEIAVTLLSAVERSERWASRRRK
jgi:CheY-like chemotaxis protein